MQWQAQEPNLYRHYVASTVERDVMMRKYLVLLFIVFLACCYQFSFRPIFQLNIPVLVGTDFEVLSRSINRVLEYFRVY